jgi:translation initiation factor IF-3
LSRPFPPRNTSSAQFFRVNGKIRAREVRVVSGDGKQLGVFSLNDALTMARNEAVDLVEIAANATPPVCRLVDYGKFRYEQAKKDKESKKHQHAGAVKEIQLSPRIDPHDLAVKTTHAIEFLSDDKKVKATLKFRGREMAHTEFGFQVINKFLQDISAYGNPDFPPKLIGKGINVMISPLPRNKRGKAPVKVDDGVPENAAQSSKSAGGAAPKPNESQRQESNRGGKSGFANNPFVQLDTK